jgi:hypothetical protein
MYISSSASSPSYNFFIIYKFYKNAQIIVILNTHNSLDMNGVHIIICHITYSNFLLSINSKKHIDNNYFKISQLHVELPTS